MFIYTTILAVAFQFIAGNLIDSYCPETTSGFILAGIGNLISFLGSIALLYVGVAG